GTSAGASPGSPYHMRLISLDGAGGNQDRSLAAASILPIPANFETTASKSSVVTGQSVTDTATLSGANGPVSGSVKFFVCGPNVAMNPDCTSGGSQLGSAKSFSNGRVDSDAYTPTTPGPTGFRAAHPPRAY